MPVSKRDNDILRKSDIKYVAFIFNVINFIVILGACLGVLVFVFAATEGSLDPLWSAVIASVLCVLTILDCILLVLSKRISDGLSSTTLPVAILTLFFLSLVSEFCFFCAPDSVVKASWLPLTHLVGILLGVVFCKGLGEVNG